MVTKLSWCPNCRRMVRLYKIIDSPVGDLGHCDGCRSTIKVDRVEFLSTVVLVSLSILALVASAVYHATH